LDVLPYLVGGTALVGLIGAAAVLRLSTDGTSPPWRLVRCFCGFICSMVWIAAIANEVVSVLLVSGASGRGALQRR
jgi:sodium/potassium/calcium exchanger 6